ncbi:hypothetical protein, partial [Staphylococcus aureus]|uniref:hypothetical protein n=1 Tax=Staphylococcus aureus TaxID=1280 RepID=UPI00301D355B
EVVPVDRNIDYILSLDYSEYQKDIIKMVNGLELNYKLIINSSNEKLGLKSHILKCGDILNDRTYEYVVILEDDLEVSNYFLSYIESVLTVLEDDV